MNFDSSKKEPPCFHRTISIQIDSPLPQDETQAVSRQSDVELHNKSSPNLIFHVFCLNLDGFKNKTPCFHRTISIQIDSPLPQDDIQAVSRRSDVVLHNKSSQNLTFYLTCLWILIALKRNLPVSTEQFQFWLTVHYPKMRLKQFQDNLMLNYIIKALQISYSTSSVWIWMALKIKLPVSTEQFQFRLTVLYPRMKFKQFPDDLMLYYKIKALQNSHYTWSAFDFEWL